MIVRPMYLADFQLCLRDHDAATYVKLRDIWEPLELAIRRAIPKRLNFGGVKKIVLELGPERRPNARFRVRLDVALLHCPDFDPVRFLSLGADEQLANLLTLVRRAMTDLSSQLHAPLEWFDDCTSEFATGSR